MNATTFCSLLTCCGCVGAHRVTAEVALVAFAAHGLTLEVAFCCTQASGCSRFNVGSGILSRFNVGMWQSCSMPARSILPLLDVARSVRAQGDTCLTRLFALHRTHQVYVNVLGQPRRCVCVCACESVVCTFQTRRLHTTRLHKKARVIVHDI